MSLFVLIPYKSLVDVKKAVYPTICKAKEKQAEPLTRK